MSGTNLRASETPEARALLEKRAEVLTKLAEKSSAVDDLRRRISALGKRVPSIVGPTDSDLPTEW